jgi:hypothetical protein
MSQLAIFETADLATTGLSKLSEFLGSPSCKVDSRFYQTRVWGKLGCTELSIHHNIKDDCWSLKFHIFTDKTSYRKILNNVDFVLAQSWLEANAEFIMENMSRGT